MLLLERGELTPPEIAAELKITRQNAYIVLAGLEKKNVVKKDNRHNKIRYNPEDPIIFKTLFEERITDIERAQDKLENAMPELYSLYNLAKDRPGVSIFQGIDGIQKLYEDTLKKAPGEILMILSKEGRNSYLTAWITRYFRPKRISKGIKIREITNTPKEVDAKELEDLLWEKKYINMPEMPKDLDILIYDDNVTFIKYNRKEPHGITIDDSLVYFSIKAFFETIWKI